MKRMVMLVIALGALGMFTATAAAAQVRVGFGFGLWRPPLSGYVVVGNPYWYAARPVLVEVVPPYGYDRPYGYRGWYRAYRPLEFERVRVYRPYRRGWRHAWRGRGW
jgi:hypothetical protein